MATVKIERFCGVAPRLHPTLLSDGMAVKAHNCRLKSGKLVPLRQPSASPPTVGRILQDGLDSVSSAKSMHIWRRTDGSFDLLFLSGVTWSERGNVADDSFTRLIVSGETGVTYVSADGDATPNTPVLYIRDGGDVKVRPIVKSPLSAPLVSRVSTDDLPESRLYTQFFITWVDAYGMESPPSPPSVSVKTYSNADGWTITEVEEDGETTGFHIQREGYADIDVAMSDTFSYSVLTNGTVTRITAKVNNILEYVDGEAIKMEPIGIDKWPYDAVAARIYKVVTGSEEGYIRFVTEVSEEDAGNGANAITFDVKDEDLGETMPEMESPPPDLVCIRAVPGGFYCGFSPSYPKTVMFSEVNLLYSWPYAYRYDISDRIVTLAVVGNTVYALTDGSTYALSGTSPDGMTVSKIAGAAGCSSPRGVCVYKYTVYFVSKSGLMSVGGATGDGGVCQNLTGNMFTKDQWEAMNPTSCVMGQFDGALHLFFSAVDGETFSGGLLHIGLVVDLAESANIAITTHDEAAKCLCVDERDDRMYYIRA